MDNLELKEDELTPAEEPVREEYKSKTGFEVVPLVRGFYEVRALHAFITPFDAFICGGYARYCASPRRETALPGDVDIYCPTQEAFDSIKEHLFESGLTQRHENDMALTFKETNDGPFKYCPSIQMVKPINEGRVVARGDRQTVLMNFDFTIVRAAILDADNVLVDADFMHDEEAKLLRIKNIHCTNFIDSPMHEVFQERILDKAVRGTEALHRLGKQR